MQHTTDLNPQNGYEQQQERAREKYIALEKNLSTILASSIDDQTKRLVISILLDYKDSLLAKMRPQLSKNHDPHADAVPKATLHLVTGKRVKIKKEKIEPIDLKSLNLKNFTAGMRQLFVERAVNLHGGNIKKTAQRLGLSRQSIYNALKGKIQ